MSIMFSALKIDRLENEFGILHLIYHRNYNQHHVAVWWKLLNMIHRNVRKILDRLRSIEDTKKILQKERLYNEACSIAQNMIKRGLFKKANYDFNSIIALGQFVTLGMVLVASLSAIYSVVADLADGSRRTVETPKREIKKNLELADDLGEEILSEAFEPLMPLNVVLVDKPRKSAYEEPPHKVVKKERKEKRVKENSVKEKSKKEKKKKEKKKKSAMDDIFG